MKRKLLLFSICFLSISLAAFSQSVPKGASKNDRLTTYRDRLKAEPRIAEYAFDDRTGTTAYVRFNDQAGFDKSKSADILGAYLPIRKNLDELIREREDAAYGKMWVQRYQQYFRGIKVEHGSYTVTAVDSKIAFMSGEYYSIDADQSVVPLLNEAAALQRAMNYVQAVKYIWQTSDSVTSDGRKPAGELVFVDNAAQPQGLRLAYKFNIYAVSPLSRAYIYVDASNGDIILEDKIIKHVAPGKATASPVISLTGNPLTTKQAEDGASPLTNSTASAATRYTGTRSITTDQVSASLFRLRETARTGGANNLGSTVETYNCKTSATYTTAVDFTDADNNWTAAEYNNAAKDNAALDAHWGAEKVVDYWWNIHGRRSIDNKGFGIRSFVHYDVAFDNAYWNGSAMTYGDGSGAAGGGFEILTAVDVCGHEIGHGLCEFTANLVYSNESGAMNEGFSDIWGACVENYAISIGDVPVGDNKEPFKIGEEIVASAAQPLRSMSNPNSTSTYGRQPDTYTGTYWYTGALDNGGVHTNSGVLNHWFYILVQGESGTNDLGNAYNVTGLGWSKAEKIAYITELNLASNANYTACRTAAINAVIALYGRCSAEHIAVTNAWYAVGVGAVFGACTSSSTVQFAINADKVYENSGKPACTYPSGAVPSFTTTATITLSNVSSATQNTDATITLSGTAVQGKDYTINPSVVTWAPGTSGSKDITITIYDDNMSESDETIVLGYTLNANGGSAVTGSFNQSETITISDDDTLASTYMYDRVLGDYDTYAGSTSNVSLFRGSTSRKKIQYFYPATEMRLAGLKEGYISHLFLYIVGTATTNTFTNLNITVGTTAAANLNSAFATFTSSASAYSGNYTTPTSENFYDFPLATPLYWDGTSNVVVQACYDGASGATNYLTAVSATGSTNICARYLTATSGASLCGSTGGTTSTTRADIAFGMYNPVQSTANLSRTAYLGPNADVSFYSASDGKLMARIVNNSSFDYGCTQVLVDRAGTSASQFWRTGVANYLTDKSFRVLPTNDNPTGSYDIYLYYTKTEHDGWEAATGKDWETLARIVKVKGHNINEVTPSTTSYFSSVDIPVSATRNSFGADYVISAGFATGFSGFAAGDPSTVPLPIKLLSFTGVKVNTTSVLNWVTSFEYNNDHFEIEVSTNGAEYHSIGSVASRGNSNIEQKYSFTDRLPSDGVNYYRLKQVDKDGTVTYSNIVKLYFNLGKYLAIYPNPVKDLLTVTLGRPAGGALVQVIAAHGKLVYNKTSSTTSRILNIDVHALPQGTYMLQLIINGEKQSRQFVKE